MRAVIIPRHGGPEVLEVRELPDPPVGEGGDADRGQGGGDQLRRSDGPRGHLPRRATAAIGDRLRHRRRDRVAGEGDVHAVGDRVLGGTRFGGYAELVTVDEDQALPLPGSFTFEQGRGSWSTTRRPTPAWWSWAASRGRSGC